MSEQQLHYLKNQACKLVFIGLLALQKTTSRDEQTNRCIVGFCRQGPAYSLFCLIPEYQYCAQAYYDHGACLVYIEALLSKVRQYHLRFLIF